MSLVFAANSAHSNALARQSSAEGGIAVSSGGQTEEGSLASHVVCPVPDGAGACRKCCQVKDVPAAPTNGLQLAQNGNTCAMCDSGNTIQERLGHSSITVTLDTRGHLFPRGDDTKELADAERMLLA